MTRAVLVDSLAALVFFTAIAAMTEYLVAGMSARQVLVSRAAMVPVLLATGRPYGLWRDAIIARSGARVRGGLALADTAAFLTFQLPLYALVLCFAGASPAQAATAIVSAILAMTVLGRPYGIFLDGFRRAASVWSGACRPAMTVAMNGSPQTTRRRRR